MPFTLFRFVCCSLFAVSLVVVSPVMAGLADEPAAKSDEKAEPSDEKAEKPGEVELKVEDITLTIPGDWNEEKPSNRLRLAQLKVPNAEGDEVETELVVSHFGGTGGGIDQNVSRWIGQFSGEGRTAKVTKGTSKQGTYYVVDLSGTFNRPVGPPILGKTEPLPNARMLAVILQVEGKGNYFLKLAGPKKTVTAAEPALRKSFGGDEKTEEKYEL